MEAQIKVLLAEKIEALFNDEEIRNLCFDMDMDYDNLQGTSKSTKIRELIRNCHVNGRINLLLNACSKQRPNTQWITLLEGEKTNNLHNILITNEAPEAAGDNPVLATGNWFEGPIFRTLVLAGFFFTTVALLYTGYKVIFTTSIRWIEIGNFVVSKGINQAYINNTPLSENIQIEIDQVYYKGQQYDSLRIVSFLILNTGKRSLPAPAQFIFVVDELEQPAIPNSIVVDIICDCQLNQSLPRLEYEKIEIENSQGIQSGINLLSRLEGSSQVIFYLVLNDDIPNYKDVRIIPRLLEKTDSESWDNLSVRTITLKTYELIAIMLIATFSYVLLITAWNWRLGNYGIGSKMIDTVLAVFLKGRKPIRQNLPKRSKILDN